MKLIWIDDNPSRKESAVNLEDEIGVKVDFKSIKGEEVEKLLLEIIQQEEPDLIIIDHILDQAVSDTIKTGSTAAIFLRDKWPSCPIVSVTAVDLDEVDFFHKSTYEYMIEAHSISKNYNKILALINGVISMKEEVISNIKQLIDLLNPPALDIENIQKIIPTRIRMVIEDESLPLKYYRWLNSLLFKRPGFLLDEDWTANLVGLNRAGFEKVKKDFKDAMYTGVFSDTSTVRYWKSDVIRILGELVDDVDLPWRLGRQLIKDHPEFYSKCYPSDEDYPETIAQLDSKGDWYPMKLKYTEPNPNYEDLYFFEKLRLMKHS